MECREEVGCDLGYAVLAPADRRVGGIGDGDEGRVRELGEQVARHLGGDRAVDVPEKMIVGRFRSGAVVGTTGSWRLGAGQVRHSSLK